MSPQSRRRAPSCINDKDHYASHRLSRLFYTRLFIAWIPAALTLNGCFESAEERAKQAAAQDKLRARAARLTAVTQKSTRGGPLKAANTRRVLSPIPLALRGQFRKLNTMLEEKGSGRQPLTKEVGPAGLLAKHQRAGAQRRAAQTESAQGRPLAELDPFQLPAPLKRLLTREYSSLERFELSWRDGESSYTLQLLSERGLQDLRAAHSLTLFRSQWRALRGPTQSPLKHPKFGELRWKIEPEESTLRQTLFWQAQSSYWPAQRGALQSLLMIEPLPKTGTLTLDGRAGTLSLTLQRGGGRALTKQRRAQIMTLGWRAEGETLKRAWPLVSSSTGP